MTKLTFGLLTLGLVAGLAFWLARDRDDQAPAPVTDAAEREAARAASAPASLPAEPDRSAPVERTPVPSSAPASKPAADGPVAVEPYVLTVEVVDVTGAVVPDARVEAWDAPRSQGSPHPGHPGPKPAGNAYSLSRSGDRPLLARMTDGGGRCRLEVGHEFVLLQARKEGVGDSGLVGFWHSTARKEALRVLKLQASAAVSVLVLRADETPAAGVSVEVGKSGGRMGASQAVVPGPQHTDREGRCRFDLGEGTIFRLSARDGGESTFPQSVSTTTSVSPREIVLRFPGALSLGGKLLDARGQPAPGEVNVWERVTPEQRRSDDYGQFLKSVECGADGGWRIDVPRPGTFDVIGSAKGSPPTEVTALEVTRETPHVRVELRLLAPMSIRGIVTRQDGTALSGAWLGLSTGESTRISGEIGPRERFGEVASVRADDAGTFAFTAVHPRAVYTLTCMPDPKKRHARLVQEGVAPGTDLRLVMKDELFQATRIVGTVVHAITRKPITEFQQVLVNYRDGKPRTSSNRQDVTNESGEFRSEELAFGATHAMVIITKDHAPATTGPITLAKEEHRCEVAVVDFGSIRVRVLEPAGSPAAHAEVNVQPKEHLPGTWFWTARPVDADGILLWEKVPPGAHEVIAFRTQGKVERKPVEVRSGQTTEVEITLPR